jgi:anti-sigma factor (TIGR02949 family)
MSTPSRYSCEDAFDRLDDYLDRALSSEELRMVREHLDLCEMCAREYRFEASLLDQIRDKLRRIAMPDDLRARVQAALARAAEEASPK